jgi:hypothetical protein
MLISVLSALVAHFISDKAEIRINKFYNPKLILTDLFLAKVKDGRGDITELESIINDANPELKQIRKNADNWIRAINIFESLTIFFVVFGFIWMVIYPLVFIK